MRVYYLSDGKIFKIARDVDPLPEDSPKTAINVPYSVLEVDEVHNRVLCSLLLRNSRGTPEHPMPDRYSVNASGQLVSSDTGEVVTINPNPNKESFKLSRLYNVTPDQARTYIGGQVNAITTLAQAKTFLKAYLPEVAAAIVYLAKQSRLKD